MFGVFESLDLRGDEQVAFYDDGVGTSSFKPLAILGGAFGWGSKRNVLDIYKFLCLNYKKDDKIFAFGFSRGAYTIRVVIGLILKVRDLSEETRMPRHIEMPRWLTVPTAREKFQTLADRVAFQATPQHLPSNYWRGLRQTQ